MSLLVLFSIAATDII